MSKAANLKKALMRQAVITGVAVLVATGLIVGSNMMASSALAKRTAAESAFNSLESQLQTMRSQAEKTGSAAVRYVEMRAKRNNEDFSADSGKMRQWLSVAKDIYRLGADSNLVLPPSRQKSDKPELAALEFDVFTLTPVKLEIDAMSDVHIYSFLDDFMMNKPGFIQINSMAVQSTGDGNFTNELAQQLRTGAAPSLVRTIIEFTWIGLQPKAQPATGGGA